MVGPVFLYWSYSQAPIIAWDLVCEILSLVSSAMKRDAFTNSVPPKSLLIFFEGESDIWAFENRPVLSPLKSTLRIASSTSTNRFISQRWKTHCYGRFPVGTKKVFQNPQKGQQVCLLRLLLKLIIVSVIENRVEEVWFWTKKMKGVDLVRNQSKILFIWRDCNVSIFHNALKVKTRR